jgi:hypothetical protein
MQAQSRPPHTRMNPISINQQTTPSNLPILHLSFRILNINSHNLNSKMQIYFRTISVALQRLYFSTLYENPPDEKPDTKIRDSLQSDP